MPVRARVAASAAACAVLLSLLGCGDDPSDGQDSAVPPVPVIDNPKDAAGIAPCSLVSDTQRGSLGLAAGTAWQGELGAGCSWRGSGSVTLSFIISLDADLEAVAADADPAAARVRLSGYPTLETFTREGAYCRYDVGNAAEQTLIATMTGGVPDSCTSLQPIVAAALDQLPPDRG